MPTDYLVRNNQKIVEEEEFKNKSDHSEYAELLRKHPELRNGGSNGVQ